MVGNQIVLERVWDHSNRSHTNYQEERSKTNKQPVLMMKHCYLIYLFIKLWRWLCITFNFNRSKYFVAVQLHGHSSRQRRNAFSEGIFHNTENESDHQQYLNFNKFHTIQPNEWLMWEFFFQCDHVMTKQFNQAIKFKLKWYIQVIYCHFVKDRCLFTKKVLILKIGRRQRLLIFKGFKLKRLHNSGW